MSNTKQLIWFKGNIIPSEEATINVLSPTAQFGANVFEGLRGYWDGSQLFIFKLDEHVERLLDSIRMMRINNPFSFDDLKNSLLDTVKANAFKEDLAVRQTVFLDGFGNWASEDKVEMFIAPIAKGRQDPDEKGYSVRVSSWERISERVMSPKIKMGANYMNSRLAQMEAVRDGYDMGIFLNARGTVAEGPGSCLFMVNNSQLITPPLTSDILDSITRKTIIELATKELNYEVVEREIDRSELYLCDELFFVGSAIEVVHANSIEKLTIGDGEIGPMTSKIKNLYLQVVKNELSTYSHWLTPVY